MFAPELTELPILAECQGIVLYAHHGLIWRFMIVIFESQAGSSLLRKLIETLLFFSLGGEKRVQ